jgi:iron complex outermembrane recepter protein
MKRRSARIGATGGVSLRFDIGQADEYLAERLWDYELFARASPFDGALSATANLFRYDMRDAQRSRLIIVFAPGGRHRQHCARCKP